MSYLPLTDATEKTTRFVRASERTWSASAGCLRAPSLNPRKPDNPVAGKAATTAGTGQEASPNPLVVCRFFGFLVQIVLCWWCCVQHASARTMSCHTTAVPILTDKAHPKRDLRVIGVSRRRVILGCRRTTAGNTRSGPGATEGARERQGVRGPEVDRTRNLTSETHKTGESNRSRMTSEQWIAIFFTVLMIGSAIAFGAVSLI